MTPSIDIPVMRGDEATYITITAADGITEDDVFLQVRVAGNTVTIDNEVVAIRTHLLIPRSRYPAPLSWDGWKDQQVPIDVDTGACKVNAAPNGLSIWVTDEYDYEPGDEPDAAIPWADVIAAMRKIGVKA